jgi:hypothetical protein
MATQTPVVNKAAVNAPPQHKEVEDFTEAERATWLKTGEMPPLEEKEPASKVPPSDGKPPKDASAASIPAKDAGSGPAKKDKPDQERNWRTLEGERDTLKEKAEAAEREIEEWRTGKRKPEEKKPDTNAPKLLEMPKRPRMADFKNADQTLDSEKYETALDKYETDKDAYVNQQVQLRTAAQQQEQSIKTWQADLKQKYGEKSDGVDVKKTVDALAGTLQEAPAFFMFLNDSEVFTDLLYVLGTDPKLSELLAEAKDPKTMTRAIRKLVLLENGVKAELAKQVKKPAEGEKQDAKPDKKLTGAGKPPIEAAGGTSSPEDDGSSDAAMKRKDLSPEERGELYRERKNKEEREKRKKKVN